MPKSRVLIIDDDPMITRLLDEHLSNEGYEVASVHMAEQGYQLATQSPPDLIFLDVMLPDATGFQVLGRLRENPVTHGIPIIMMSGTARYPNQMEIGKNMGANAYVVKPFNVIEVGEKARELIGISRDDRPKSDIFAEPAPQAEPQERWTPLIEIKPTHVPDVPPEIEKEITMPRASVPIVFMSDNADIRQESAESSHVQPIAEEPARTSSVSAPRFKIPGPLWAVTAGLFSAHIVITLISAQARPLSSLSYVIGGWALMIGLVVTICAVLGIKMEAIEAITFVRWAAVPIVARALFTLMGFLPKTAWPTQPFWLRPLDLFEMVSVVIFGLCFRNLRGSSTKKSIIAAIFMAIGWTLTSRGYFLPH